MPISEKGQLFLKEKLRNEEIAAAMTFLACPKFLRKGGFFENFDNCPLENNEMSSLLKAQTPLHLTETAHWSIANLTSKDQWISLSLCHAEWHASNIIITADEKHFETVSVHNNVSFKCQRVFLIIIILILHLLKSQSSKVLWKANDAFSVFSHRSNSSAENPLHGVQLKQRPNSQDGDIRKEFPNVVLSLSFFLSICLSVCLPLKKQDRGASYLRVSVS